MDTPIPEFLAEEIKEYLASIYGIKENDRIFQNSKSYFRHEMIRGSKAAGVKRIRIHDLRHAHACRSKGRFEVSVLFSFI